ncbi:hypothetical protein BSKO_00540 [Bryopsis sp. KO-2023]|nr:hypothetical protein BSKO_00540 [Bryopsis sp. KO-2023]
MLFGSGCLESRPTGKVSCPSPASRVSSCKFLLRRERWHCLPLDSLIPTVIGTDVAETLGVAIVSASAAFTAGRITSAPQTNEIEGNEESVRVPRGDAQQTADNEPSVVPSSEEIWTEAWAGLQIAQSTPNVARETGASPRDASGKRFTIKGHSRLCMQALQLPVRRQLLALSLGAVQHRVSQIDLSFKQKSNEDFLREVASIYIECSRAVGEEWMGYTPDFGMSDDLLRNRFSTREEKDLKDSRKSELPEAWEGIYTIVQEKLPVHAAIIRYLRFGPDSLESRLSAVSISEPRTPQPSIGVPDDPVLQPTSDSKQTQMVILNAEASGGQQLDIRERRGEVSGIPSEVLAMEPMAEIFKNGVLTAGRNQVGSSAGDLLGSSSQIMQDMAVCVGEMVVNIWLRDIKERSATGSSELAGFEWPSCLQASISSTRILERFRNQVLLNWWMRRNVYSVVAIFEDYHWLWGFRNGGRLLQRKVQVRRNRDLLNLKGWRLFLSYCLETLDALEPMAKSVCLKLGGLFVFLLTSLIGRALGLIFKGVQKSLEDVNSGKKKQDKKPNQDPIFL